MTVFLVAAAVFGLVFLGVITYVHKRTNGMDTAFFASRWDSIKSMSQHEPGWVQSIVDADKLLDEALKQARYNGKNMAERMVSANRAFSDPDSVWRAHKIRNKVVHETRVTLRQSHVNAALRGFHKALKDLGAL